MPAFLGKPVKMFSVNLCFITQSYMLYIHYTYKVFYPDYHSIVPFLLSFLFSLFPLHPLFSPSCHPAPPSHDYSNLHNFYPCLHLALTIRNSFYEQFCQSIEH